MMKGRNKGKRSDENEETFYNDSVVVAGRLQRGWYDNFHLSTTLLKLPELLIFIKVQMRLLVMIPKWQPKFLDHSAILQIKNWTSRGDFKCIKILEWNYNGINGAVPKGRIDW